MAEARRLLVETDLPVEEVGRRVGYGDTGYFASMFRRAQGVTPLDCWCLTYQADFTGHPAASVPAGFTRGGSPVGMRLIGRGFDEAAVPVAGANVPQGVFDVDEESWDAVIDTNLKGSFFAAQAVARHMVERGGGGRIINVGSQAGVVGIEERSTGAGPLTTLQTTADSGC